jgi:uncharacterized protein
VPVTSLYAGLLVALFLVLTFRVILFRRGRRVDMGDGGHRLLQRWIRAHGNFVEYAPIGLLLLLLVEAAGWPAWLLHGLGVMLLMGRLSHAWSFSVEDFRPAARVVGMVLTTTMLGIAGILCLLRGLALA